MPAAARALLLVALTLWCLPGCQRRAPPTPAAGYERLQAALADGRGARFYEALDQQSQWSVISIMKYYRQIRQVVQTGYPSPARERELTRILEPHLARPETFFAALESRRGWRQRYLGHLGAVAKVEAQGERAVVQTARGGRLDFSRSDLTGWGFAGLRSELEDLKRRASHDVEMVRENARLYQRSSGSPAGSAGTR